MTLNKITKNEKKSKEKSVEVVDKKISSKNNYKLRNGSEYNKGLVNRGKFTLSLRNFNKSFFGYEKAILL